MTRHPDLELHPWAITAMVLAVGTAASVPLLMVWIGIVSWPPAVIPVLVIAATIARIRLSHTLTPAPAAGDPADGDTASDTASDAAVGRSSRRCLHCGADTTPW